MDSVVVTTPARLHFGMFSFGVPTERQFGGAGVMIDGPSTKLRLARAEADSFAGPHANRYAAATRQARSTAWGDRIPPVRITAEASPPAHRGLGSGTQTALAVVAGLRALAGLAPPAAAELVEASGRARRSAVGLHGFLHGGLIVEAGRLPHDRVSPLVAAVDVPAAWRFVLICPRGGEGLSGEPERAAFATLPSVPQRVTDELCRTALLELIPAARQADFAGFSEAVFRFGFAAGECFKRHQSGVYATEQLAGLVADIRAGGVAGVGQSSWGPTLFTLHPSADAAERFIADFRRRPDSERLEISVATPNQGGARLE
jgi:beta-ribofuranosylaminobenzene 5'-phosphate synthase